MNDHENHTKVLPNGLIIAGLSGGSGKSVISVGLTAAYTAQGKKIAPFKKGPDYIDAGWMQTAANWPCYNLDPYLMSATTIKSSCTMHAAGRELALIEGNRGLFDGVNVTGAYSTAELADILNLPILLVVDCTKTTRTIAALLMGCQQMGENITIAGTVLNRIGSSRHQSIVQQSIEHYTDIPVLGAMPRLDYDIFPQRHIGITPCPEFAGAKKAVRSLASVVTEHMDLPAINALAQPLTTPTDSAPLYSQPPNLPADSLKIGVIKDAAFQFYYPENLKALELLGAKIIEINALTETTLPDIDGLYIGGGFPETNVGQLSANESFRKSLKKKIDTGLPVYAECGGLIYLGKEMEVDGQTYPLTGVFDVSFTMEKKPQAHGYTILEANKHNPFYPAGTSIKGHEFRYSRITAWPKSTTKLAFAMQRGTGFADGCDGLIYKNVLALYTHVHTFGTPEWAKLFVDKVRNVKDGG